MGLPLISIVMPLYNKEKEVDRALRSAISQTFADFELIVINDGSTDKGPDVVYKMRDERIRIIDQTHQGVSAARNRGISETNADLIAFLDADDEWKPDFLETILRLVNSFPEASVFAAGYTITLPDGSVRPALVRGLPELFSKGILMDYFGIACRSDPPLWTSAVAVRKKAIKSVGGFPVGISAGEDLLTWARLAVKYKIACSMLPKATFYAPARMEDRPARYPQEPDRVAAGLKDILNDPALPVGTKKGLPLYIGLWHRMRSVVFIKLNDGVAARREIFSAIHYSGLTLRLILLLLFSLLPNRLMANSFHLLSRFRSVLTHGKP